MGDERQAAGADARLSCPPDRPRLASSLSAKWLSRIWLRDKAHDGVGMGGTSYRVPVKPMLPGSTVNEKNLADLEWMPVRALITSPADGTRFSANTRDQAAGCRMGRRLRREVGGPIRGFRCELAAHPSEPTQEPLRLAGWTAPLKLPSDGYFEIWSRATDQRGIMEPHVAGNGNPNGYGANPLHRIAILVGWQRVAPSPGASLPSLARRRSTS